MIELFVVWTTGRRTCTSRIDPIHCSPMPAIQSLLTMRRQCIKAVTCLLYKGSMHLPLLSSSLVSSTTSPQIFGFDKHTQAQICYLVKYLLNIIFIINYFCVTILETKYKELLLKVFFSSVICPVAQVVSQLQ